MIIIFVHHKVDFFLMVCKKNVDVNRFHTSEYDDENKKIDKEYSKKQKAMKRWSKYCVKRTKNRDDNIDMATTPKYGLG